MLGIPVAGKSSAVDMLDLGLKLMRADLLRPEDVHPPKKRRRAPAKPKTYPSWPPMSGVDDFAAKLSGADGAVRWLLQPLRSTSLLNRLLLP